MFKKNFGGGNMIECLEYFVKNSKFVCVCVCVFLGPLLQHIEVTRLGFKSELQLQPTPQPKPHGI